MTDIHLTPVMQPVRVVAPELFEKHMQHLEAMAEKGAIATIDDNGVIRRKVK